MSEDGPPDSARCLAAGKQAHSEGRPDRAEALYKEAVRQDPGNHEAWHCLAFLAHQRGQDQRALESIDRAIQVAGDRAAYHNLRGALLHRSGEAARGHEAMLRAGRLEPGNPDILANLAGSARALGDAGQAAGWYRKALEKVPGNSALRLPLAECLIEQGDHRQAAAELERFLADHPDHADAHCHLGVARAALGQRDEAEACYRRAIALQGDRAVYYQRLGSVLLGRGRHAEAIEAYRRALALDPEDGVSAVQLAYEKQRICQWGDPDDPGPDDIEALARGAGPIIPFSFMTLPSTPAQQLACARRRAAGLRGLARYWREDSPVKAAGGKLRIGYFSEDFRVHPVAQLIVELFEQHDRRNFELHAYSFGPAEASPFRGRLERAFDRFHDIRDMSGEAAARRIHDDGIDILVDLSGYTGKCRPDIPARRPAPVQINFLGYPGTTGAPWMDYIVVDPFLVPPGSEQYYSEKLLVMPDCYQPNAGLAPRPGTPVSREEAGLPSQGLVFCCFNNTYKITPGVFGVWMELLREVPGSVLWLLGTNEQAMANLKREASSRGVDSDRIVFAPRLAHEAHLARHALADLFLDTWPVNAHTTASDALRVGCPLVTLAGDSFISRVAGSLLHCLGLGELVCSSLRQYRETALHYAVDTETRRALRETLGARLADSPLFDIERYTRHFEAGLQAVWSRYRQGLPPDHVHISEERSG